MKSRMKEKKQLDFYAQFSSNQLKSHLSSLWGYIFHISTLDKLLQTLFRATLQHDFHSKIIFVMKLYQIHYLCIFCKFLHNFRKIPKAIYVLQNNHELFFVRLHVHCTLEPVQLFKVKLMKHGSWKYFF